MPRWSLVELVIVLAISQLPLFVLASEISGDEYAKASSGMVLAGASAAAAAVYRAWKGTE